jgi:uncharacterized lipoprotein YmbA
MTKRVLIGLAALLAACSSCTMPAAAYIASDYETYIKVGPEYERYVRADPTLTANQLQRRVDAITAWKLRLRAAGVEVGQ